MNGARTTFMRRGYLLTALAAVVLLAASPGTASAQSVGFEQSSATITEGATRATTDPVHVELAVRRTGITDSPDNRASLGTLSLNHNGLAVGITVSVVRGGGYDGATGSNITFNNNDHEVLLRLESTAANTQWMDREFVMELVSDNLSANLATRRFVMTITDVHTQPTVKFTNARMRLTQGSKTSGSVMIDRGRDPRTQVNAATLGTAFPASSIMFTTSGGVVGSACSTMAAPVNPPPVLIVTDPDTGNANVTGPDANGVFTIVRSGQDLTASATYAEIDFEACPSDTFKNTEIMVSFVGRSLRGAGSPSPGTLAAASATVEILSNEPTPTVGFVPTDIAIPEGGSTRVVLAADGPKGAEVMMVKLSVEGDAMVSLMNEDGDTLEEMNGYVMVDLGNSANVKLTAMSHSDPDLMDGEMKSKTWKIMEADGADIDQDAYWLTVTVEGSTAVPALPLVGQLLLALFLMAGGSRLYRRRNG